MNYPTRDTILAIGPSADGKTESLNIIRELVKARNIPHIFAPHSDSHTILTRMYEDDEKNHGRGHYHPWNTQEERWNGHTHRDYNKDKPLPFTFTGNDVAHKFIYDFFKELRELPYTGELRFAELSGGVNINDFDEPASKTDLAFATYDHFLRRGQFHREGLSRILAVFHPETDDDIRYALNSSRGIPTDDEIINGTASWPLSLEAMRIFGEDDFFSLEPLFHEMKIPHIYTITNDGGQLLRKDIEYRLPAILTSWEGAIQKETPRSRYKEQ